MKQFGMFLIIVICVVIGVTFAQWVASFAVKKPEVDIGNMSLNQIEQMVKDGKLTFDKDR